MIDTAGSVESLIRALGPLKPAEINIIAVHALFSAPAAQRLNQLAQEGLLNRIIVSDTVCPRSFSKSATENPAVLGENPAGSGREIPPVMIPHMEVVPSAELSARIIRTLVVNESMSKLMRTFDASIYLKSPVLFNQ